jgi:hypothetical protein
MKGTQKGALRGVQALSPRFPRFLRSRDHGPVGGVRETQTPPNKAADVLRVDVPGM